eukprot:15640253-Heterocapsa_arctica.AAC.1
MTDEQTNRSFFNGKETRKKAMLKAKQIQMHNRANTMKGILNKDEKNNENKDNQVDNEVNEETHSN